LVALVEHLPPGSATVRQLDPNDGWSQEQELLATIVDMMGENTRVLLAANGVKKLPEPTRFPRPGDDRLGKRVQSDTEDVRAFFVQSDMNFVDNKQAWGEGD
jgi:hypothetical protein